MGIWSRSIALLTVAVATALVAAGPATSSDGRVRAGVAAVDASWHVGASAGPVRDRRQLRRGPRRRPHHALVPPQRLLRDPVPPPGARAGRRGPRRHAASRSSRTTSTSRRTCSTAARRSCSSRATPGITRANLTMAVTHDHSSPVLLLHLVGRVGVPGRLRRAVLRLLREAHGGGRRAGRRRPEAGPRSAPR